MKKLFIVISLILVLSIFMGCRVVNKRWSRTISYEDPQTLGGYWTLIYSGEKYEHCKCIYWGTEDDTAMFDWNGTTICSSGTVLLIKE